MNEIQNRTAVEDNIAISNHANDAQVEVYANRNWWYGHQNRVDFMRKISTLCYCTNNLYRPT